MCGEAKIIDTKQTQTCETIRPILSSYLYFANLNKSIYACSFAFFFFTPLPCAGPLSQSFLVQVNGRLVKIKKNAKLA